MPNNHCTECGSILDDYEIDVCNACKKDAEKEELDNEHDEDDEYECSECGGKLRNFLHTCVGQKELTPVFGCPVCDDRCGFCG